MRGKNIFVMCMETIKELFGFNLKKKPQRGCTGCFFLSEGSDDIREGACILDMLTKDNNCGIHGESYIFVEEDESNLNNYEE